MPAPADVPGSGDTSALPSLNNSGAGSIGLIVLNIRLAAAALCIGCAVLLQAADDSGLRPWNDYRTIMWIGDSAYRKPEKIALFYQRLREMGINTGMVHNDGNVRPLLENHFPFYVENMVNRGLCLKFSSKVTDWDKFVTQWAKTGRGESALVRDYCLDDPQWRNWATKEMQLLVRKMKDHGPLAYDIRDELSTTISANPFDYDFNPIALASFRTWLKTKYSNLAALNAEWETKFASWDDVRPFTTDQIKNRMASGDAIPSGKPEWSAVQAIKFRATEARRNPTRWNFSPWCDFRSYMDLSLARALNDIRAAAHAIDPQTPVGIEGTQMPSAWGGYDLERLSGVLDWVEPYDIGNAREIFGSFMPGKPVLTTVFEKDTAHASRRLWHLLLEGDRGCLIWWSEDCIDWKSDDYALTSKAKALAPVLKEMTSPLARLFLRAERVRDPIFIVYSQPSIQVDWLLESTVDGSTWLRRFSSFESDHNLMAKKRNGWVKLFQDLGYSPQFVGASTLASPALARSQNAALVLSDAWALSDAEAAGAASFAAPESRTALFADGAAAAFDEHGKLRAKETPLTRYVADGRVTVTTGGATDTAAGDIAGFARMRSSGKADEWYSWAGKFFAAPREITVPAETHTRIHRFKAGAAQLVAFERNIDYHMSEDLKQAGGNETLEKPVEIIATLARPQHIYDLRARKYVGNTNRISFTLDPWQPSLFALLPEGGPAEAVIARLLAEN